MPDNPYMVGKVVGVNNNDNGTSYTVLGSDGKEYYCHFSDILEDGYKILFVGDMVRFIPVTRNNRDCCSYVVNTSDHTYNLEFIYDI